jgi:glycosyltransferase involved in cell wall biosynthesis
MLGFAKGLKELGNRIFFFIIYPGYSSKNAEIKGICEGIEYEYLCDSSYFKKNSLLEKLKEATSGISNIVKRIYYIQKTDKIDSIIFGTNNLMQTFPVYIMCKKYGIKMFREYNEYPKEELGISKKIPVITRIKYKLEFNIFDGMILISKELMNFFDKILKEYKKKLLCPIIVDPSRFNNCCSKYVNKKNIVLIGDLIGNKDGIMDLIDSFSKIHEEIPDQKLILIGDISNKKKYLLLKEKLKKKGVLKKVHFTGYIGRNQVVPYLCKAKALVLSRPDNKQGKAGFPTKLGEYLATGNPVICTKVSDIPLYLKDGLNAFLCEPGDIDGFSRKILEIFMNPEEAEQVGKNGQKLAHKDFNYKYQSKRIESFIRDSIN